MRAVDVGVGHDDDAVITQVVRITVLARSAAERLDQVGDLLIGDDLGAGRGSDVEDLAADRQDRLRLAVARLLSAAAGAVALNDK